jgi:hypothetical protein
MEEHEFNCILVPVLKYKNTRFCLEDIRFEQKVQIKSVFIIGKTV